MKLGFIPKDSGVYVGFSAENECLYVGSTLSLRARITSHKHREACDRWEWITVPPERLAIVEQEYIDRLNPTLNRSRKAWRSKKLTKKAVVGISLSSTLMQELDNYAESTGESRSVVIQRAIREGLERAQKAAK